MKCCRKRWLAILIALLLPLRVEAGIAVNLSEAFLLTDAYEIAIPPGAYASITKLEDTGLYAGLDETGTLRLLREDGSSAYDEPLTDIAYHMGELVLCAGGKYGVVDKELNTLVPFEYTLLTGAAKHTYFALKGEPWDDVSDVLYVVAAETKSTENRLLYPPEAVNTLPVPAVSADTGRFGYLDAEGQWQIAATLLAAGEFENGMACACSETGCGVLNEHGDWLIQPEYDAVRLSGAYIACAKGTAAELYLRDSEGCKRLAAYDRASIALAGRYAAVSLDGETRLVNIDGKTMATLPAETSVSAGLGSQFIAEHNENFTLYREDGTAASGAYDALSILFRTENAAYYLCAAKVGSDWRAGVIDGDGNPVLECRYLQIKAPAAGYFAAEDEDGMWVYRATENGAVLCAFAPYSAR